MLKDSYQKKGFIKNGSMNDTMTITLSGVVLTGVHGLYAEEKLLGNEFRLDLNLSYNIREEVISSIDHTIDYVKVYELVKLEFDKPEALLESLAMRMGAVLKQNFPQVRAIEISIQKLHPPLLSFRGSTGVTYKKEFRP
jgi:7,8-dihydroneopterin aldolase/epimerase/oxygenase